jgi:hypothetical protein
MTATAFRSGFTVSDIKPPASLQSCDPFAAHHRINGAV